MTLTSTVVAAYNAFLDFLYPPECVICHTPGSFLCAECFATIEPIDEPVCTRCGYPLPHPDAPCAQCRRFPLQAIDSLRSAAFFKTGVLREAIHKFKYQNMEILGKSLAPLLTTCYTINQMKAQVVVPVPLHKSRQKQRGYNQSAILAAHLATALDLPVDTASLIRHRHTKPQMSLSAAQRQLNVADAFFCRTGAVSGKAVLLIDDVCTTGATLDACASALKMAGASSVSALTLARAE